MAFWKSQTESFIFHVKRQKMMHRENIDTGQEYDISSEIQPDKLHC